MTTPEKPEDEDVMCDACHATGNINHDCETCEGNGWVEDPSDGGTMTCPDCGGVEDCPKCDGEGYLYEDES